MITFPWWRGYGCRRPSDGGMAGAGGTAPALLLGARSTKRFIGGINRHCLPALRLWPRWAPLSQSHLGTNHHPCSAKVRTSSSGRYILEPISLHAPTRKWRRPGGFSPGRQLPVARRGGPSAHGCEQPACAGTLTRSGRILGQGTGVDLRKSVRRVSGSLPGAIERRNIDLHASSWARVNPSIARQMTNTLTHGG